MGVGTPLTLVAYVSIRQHTPAYVSIRQHMLLGGYSTPRTLTPSCYIYVYTYIHIYVWIYIYIYIVFYPPHSDTILSIPDDLSDISDHFRSSLPIYIYIYIRIYIHIYIYTLVSFVIYIFKLHVEIIKWARFKYIYICMYVYIYIYTYIYARARARTHTHTHTHQWQYIFTYILPLIALVRFVSFSSPATWIEPCRTLHKLTCFCGTCSCSTLER